MMSPDETLSTFLSKFDDKVAAIWGGRNDCAAQNIGYNIYNNNNNNYKNKNNYNNNLYYSESYISTSNTPVGGSMYPWASPTSASSESQSYYHRNNNNNNNYYNAAKLDWKLEQQKQFLAQYSTPPNANNANVIGNKMGMGVNQHHKPAHIPLNTTSSSEIQQPPKFLNSMKKYFAETPIDDYHIFTRIDVESSTEETEKSLKLLDHAEESCFKRYIPQPVEPSAKHQLTTNVSTAAAEDSDSENDEPLRKTFKSELSEVEAMQQIFNELDLEDDEDEDAEVNMEIAYYLRGNPKTFIEQTQPIDLLNSWKTHFTTIDVIEKNGEYDQPSFQTSLAPHQIITNLPEYRLFAGNDNEYNVFLRPVKTLFPIKFKLRSHVNDKAVQTENPNSVTTNTTSATPNPNSSNALETDIFNQLSASVFGWENFNNSNNNDINDYVFNLVSRGSQTPQFDYDSLDTHASELFAGAEGLGAGFLNANGTDLLDPGEANFGPHTFHQSEYCCDSGIGIDASSRSGFYDDVYPDYETEFDYNNTTTTTGEGGAGGFATNTDVDYGQFQGFSYDTWSSSSTSGKTTKSSRRRQKLKPCKYFLLDGSCKRGQNCKFSHELTTCRYWAEGSCLKGDACPYLHCYVERSMLDGTEEFRKRYHLQSENDFPTLASTKGNEMRSSREQLSEEYQQTQLVGGPAPTGLLMLADPAGSIYESCTLYQGGHFSSFPPPVQQVVKGAKKSRHGTSEGTSFGTSTTRSNRNRKGGKSQTDGTGINNNNWISSSIVGAKEKRKKKKH